MRVRSVWASPYRERSELRSSAIGCGAGCKEIVRLAAQLALPPGNDYVLIGRRAALSLPFEQIAKDFTARAGARSELRSHDRPEEHNPRHRPIRARTDRVADFISACRRSRNRNKSSSSRRRSDRSPPGTPAPQSRRPGAAPLPARRPASARRSRVAARRHDPRGGARRLAARARSRRRASRARSSLKGGRIDDLSLIKYRETVDPRSPPIVLLSPSGSPAPFYSEFGWVRGGRHQREGAGPRHARGDRKARARSPSAGR